MLGRGIETSPRTDNKGNRWDDDSEPLRHGGSGGHRSGTSDPNQEELKPCSAIYRVASPDVGSGLTPHETVPPCRELEQPDDPEFPSQ